MVVNLTIIIAYNHYHLIEFCNNTVVLSFLLRFLASLHLHWFSVMKPLVCSHIMDSSLSSVPYAGLVLS